MYTTPTNVSVIEYPLYIMPNALMIMIGLSTARKDFMKRHE